MQTSESHAERTMEWKFLTMLEHFHDLKNKYCMADHSVLVPIEDEIYVDEDGTRYRPSSGRHAYGTDDFYGSVNQNTNNSNCNVMRSGSTQGDYS